MVRHTICQQVLSMLHHTPTHITDLTASPGWERLFLWLLTPFEPTPSGCGTPLASPITSVNESPSVTYIALKHEDGSGVEGVKADMASPELDEKESYNDGDDRICAEPVLPSVDVEDVTCVTSTRPNTLTSKFGPLSEPIGNLLATPKGQSPTDGPRHRSTAFMDSSTQSKGGVQVIGKKVVDKRSGCGLSKKQSLTYSRSWSNLSEVEEEEIRRTFSVVTETIAYLLWHSVDFDNGKPPWKVMSCDVIHDVI